ncbi:MAG TPA: TonB-dependent receptor [Croceibacterium sp.]
MALAGAPAFAQDTPTPITTISAEDLEENSGEVIVVTGTLFQDAVTPSPVTTITTENLDARGISTTQEGIQRIAANNGPALTNSFTANGAFAAGASAVSLRGLTTNSTLVLFDGMRAAYYPLADDGTRNFVDLNTIPDDIVERVDVLRDGASSTYGADAIAGVVNIITKKEFQGIAGRVEAGISSRGDAGQQRASLTVGFGDLADNGVNAYFSGFYYHQDMLKNSERPYPFNTDDFSQVCSDQTGEEVCGSNGIINGDLSHGAFGIATPYIVRPRNPATGGAIPGVSPRYQLLNGCGGFPTYTPTAAELALPNNAAAPASGPVCQEDLTELYGVITPDIKRFGASARVTAAVGAETEAYAQFNFLQSQSFDSYIPSTIRGNAPAPFYFPRYSTSANVAFYGNNTILQLPVYVCPQGTTVACTAANGQLNPNNPFAAQGYSAAIAGRIPNMWEENFSRTRAFRGAIGIDGPISDKWDYSVNATAMHIDLQRKNNGYVYIQHLLNVIADGSFNFVNPGANSQEIMDYVAPEARATSTSDLYQIDAKVSGELAELSGGPLEVAGGVSVRYEAVDSPSINSDINGGTQRYFRLNGFAIAGDRTVFSAYGEVNAPVVDMLTLNVSGRYDKYPDGIDNFSPKAGVIFEPFGDIFQLRGTYSKGFRIPSFGEANATFPTTGYVNATVGIYDNFFLNQYGCNSSAVSASNPNGYTACPAYVTGASYGQTSLSNPDLKPEKSESWTVSAGLEPMRGLRFEAGYYNIKKTDVITTANNAPAIEAYYSGQPIPAGYTVVPDAPDVNRPLALPRIAFVQSGFINANELNTEGLDFSVDLNVPLSDSIQLTTFAEASYIMKLETVYPDGTVERYDGTLGNFNLTAGSGTPKWKGTWSTGLEFGDDVIVTGTLNYFDGYDTSATDQGTGYKDCGLNSGEIPCRVSSYITVDLNTQYEVSDMFTIYGTIQNLLDDMPPVDTITYGAHGYNPIQGGEGIYGRYFKVGAKVNF